MNFKLGTKVTSARKEGSNIKVSVENVKDPSKKEEVRVYTVGTSYTFIF